MDNKILDFLESVQVSFAHPQTPLQLFWCLDNSTVVILVMLVATFQLSVPLYKIYQAGTAAWDCPVCIIIGYVSHGIVHKEGCFNSVLSEYIIDSDGELEGVLDSILRNTSNATPLRRDVVSCPCLENFSIRKLATRWRYQFGSCSFWIEFKATEARRCLLYTSYLHS